MKPLVLLIIGGAAMLTGCATIDAGTPPTLDKIELRETVDRYDKIYPTFYFHTPDGDVTTVHREIISTNASHQNFNPVSRINVDSDQQRRGAVWVGGWGCGPNPSKTVVRAYLTDSRGNRSNSVEYTVVCKGAAELFGGKSGVGSASSP